MSDIIPFTPSIGYVELHKGTRIFDLSYEDIKERMAQILKNIYYVSGHDQKVHEQDLHNHSSLMATDLKNKYGHLTMAEVWEFMNRGVRKEFGEYYGLSIVTYNDWAKAFIALPERHAALQTGHKLKEKEKEKELSVDDIKDLNEKSIATMIDTYKRTGEVLNFGNGNFKYLWNTRQLKFDEAKKNEYLQKAETIVNNQLALKRIEAAESLRKQEVKSIDSEIESLIEGNNPDVKKEAAKLALIDYIESL